MTELKSCPFCGGKACLESSGNYYPTVVFRVLCVKDYCCMQSHYYDKPESAAKAWNRRVSDG